MIMTPTSTQLKKLVSITVLDNSNQNTGGEDASGSTITASGTVSVLDAEPDRTRTRTYSAQGVFGSASLGHIDEGKVINFDFT